jgi:uncharacterized RDD family membrane protein YckC
LHAAIDTTTEIETPEHIRFQHRIAGPTRRAVAYVIDAIIRYGFFVIVALLALMGGLFAPDELSSASQGVILVTLFVVEWLYYVLFEAIMNGRSPGKALLRLRVVGVDGRPLQLSDSLLRNLLRAADWLPLLYALGFFVMSRDHRFRRFGDMVAGTMVVIEDRHQMEAPVQIYPPPSEVELRWFPERLPLSTEDIDAIELLLRRLPQLGAARADELAELVAPLYARRFGYHGRIGQPARFLAVLYWRMRAARGDAHA